MKHLRTLFVFLVLVIGLAAAQTAVVTRNVNLRPDPSTDNAPVKKLTPGTHVELLEPDPTAGFSMSKPMTKLAGCGGRGSEFNHRQAELRQA